jgi:hypothetical protein
LRDLKPRLALKYASAPPDIVEAARHFGDLIIVDQAVRALYATGYFRTITHECGWHLNMKCIYAIKCIGVPLLIGCTAIWIEIQPAIIFPQQWVAAAQQ